jgi:hypothetical protein
MAAPSEEAIEEAALELGMDPVADKQYLGIAHAFLSTPLPSQWSVAETEDEDGDIILYYYNEAEDESVWEHPLLEKFKERYRRAKAKDAKKSKEASKDSSKDKDKDKNKNKDTKKEAADQDRKKREEEEAERAAKKEAERKEEEKKRVPVLDDIVETNLEESFEDSPVHRPAAHPPADPSPIKSSPVKSPEKEDSRRSDKKDKRDDSRRDDSKYESRSDSKDKEARNRAKGGKSEASSYASSERDRDRSDRDRSDRDRTSDRSTSRNEERSTSRNDNTDVSGKTLDTYMESRGFGRNTGTSGDITPRMESRDKPLSRSSDSRTNKESSSMRGDSRGTAASYDTYTDSIPDERSMRRKEEKQRSSATKASSKDKGRRYNDDDNYSSNRALNNIDEEWNDAVSAPPPPPDYSSLRPEPQHIEDLRRKAVATEDELNELKDVIAEWKRKGERSDLLNQEHTDLIQSLKKQVRELGTSRDELAHQNALLEIKLNKNIANGVISEDGAPGPVSQYEREKIEAAAGARARSEADDRWTGKIAALREEHTAKYLLMESEMAALKLQLQTDKETHSYEKHENMASLSSQTQHVHDVSTVAGETKQKLLMAEQALEMSRANEIELMAKAQSAVERSASSERNRHEAEDKLIEANARADIADSALTASAIQVTELEAQCGRLRNDLSQLEKKHADDRTLLARLKLKESYEDEETMILKNQLRSTQDVTSREERELRKTIGELTGQLSTLKRQLIVSQEEANERTQTAESARAAAEWDKARAIERCATLEASKTRENERAARAELAASAATDEIVTLKREMNLVKENETREKLDYKEKMLTAQDATKRLERQLAEEKKICEEKVSEAEFKVESVRNEVTRKVPELAAAALRQAEEEWKKRCDMEVDKIRVERDQYIVDAQGALEGLRSTVGGYRAKEAEVQGMVDKLQNELKTLEKENRTLKTAEKAASSMKENSAYNMNDATVNNTSAMNMSANMSNMRNTSGLGGLHSAMATPALYHRSMEEVAANATLAALQGQLGLMQQQCKMLLTDGIDSKGSSGAVSEMSIQDLSMGVGMGIPRREQEERDAEVEHLFASPDKSRSSRSRRTPSQSKGREALSVTFDDEDGVGVGDDSNSSFDLREVSVTSHTSVLNRSMNKSSDMTSSGFYGNLWKSRYGKKSGGSSAMR